MVSSRRSIEIWRVWKNIWKARLRLDYFNLKKICELTHSNFPLSKLNGLWQALLISNNVGLSYKTETKVSTSFINDILDRACIINDLIKPNSLCCAETYSWHLKAFYFLLITTGIYRNTTYVLWTTYNGYSDGCHYNEIICRYNDINRMSLIRDNIVYLQHLSHVVVTTYILLSFYRENMSL